MQIVERASAMQTTSHTTSASTWSVRLRTIPDSALSSCDRGATQGVLCGIYVDDFQLAFVIDNHGQYLTGLERTARTLLTCG